LELSQKNVSPAQERSLPSALDTRLRAEKQIEFKLHAQALAAGANGGVVS